MRARHAVEDAVTIERLSMISAWSSSSSSGAELELPQGLIFQRRRPGPDISRGRLQLADKTDEHCDEKSRAAPAMITNPFKYARRTGQLSPSMIRELMKLMGRPGLVSLGGGLPSPGSFPTEEIRESCQRVLSQSSHMALQYTTTEGLLVLREWVAERMRQQGLTVSADQVLITSGSQQGLDLVGKVLLERGTKVAVESPTYLGALQAFAPYEADTVEVRCDEFGPMPGSLRDVGDARALYLLPNFQNPTGRCISKARRAQIADQAQSLGLPLVEDDPYGDLWFEQPPAEPIAAHWPEGTVYLGSFSKILAPGLRLGYAVAPTAVYGKLVQAKQAADLHSGTFAQHVVADLLGRGILEKHLTEVRAKYRQGRDAMVDALQAHMRGLASWSTPTGGMFCWLTLASGLDTAKLLPLAVERGVSFVPGAAFYAADPLCNAMRLSFVTESAGRIMQGVASLADSIRQAAQAQNA